MCGDREDFSLPVFATGAEDFNRLSDNNERLDVFDIVEQDSRLSGSLRDFGGECKAQVGSGRSSPMCGVCTSWSREKEHRGRFCLSLLVSCPSC